VEQQAIVTGFLACTVRNLAFAVFHLIFGGPQDVPAPLQAEGLLYCGSAAPVEQALSLHWPM